MACWIALHLPYLALEIAASFTPADAQTTVVLAQSRVWQAGEAARAAGVQNGMRRGGALHSRRWRSRCCVSAPTLPLPRHSAC